MGSYGFGPARAAAAAVEQYADEHGISWPRAMAPFDVELVVLGKEGSEERALADRLYDELQDARAATLYDDRDAGPGEKFADAELLGCPVRVTVGRRTLAAGEIEVQIRRGPRGADGAAGGRGRGDRRAVAGRCPEAGSRVSARPITKRRLFGIDRSGPAAGADALDPAAEPVDDPERDRLRPARADPGVPRGRVLERRRRTTRSPSCCSP